MEEWILEPLAACANELVCRIRIYASVGAYIIIGMVGIGCTEAEVPEGGASLRGALEEMVSQPEVVVWSVREILRIGSLDGPDDALVGLGNRPWELVAMGSEGDLFIGQPQYSHIRVFSRSGELVATIGAPGAGPGEFTSLMSLGINGDTLYGVNRSPGRVSSFSASPPYRHVGTSQFVFNPGIAYLPNAPPRQILPGGRGAIVDPVLVTPRVGEEENPLILLLRVDQGGPTIDTLFQASSTDRFIPVRVGGAFTRIFTPVANHDLVAVSPDGGRVAVVDRSVGDSRFRVTVSDLEGGGIYDLSYAYAPIPISRAFADSIIQDTGRSLEQLDPQAAAALREQIVVPDHFPPFERVLYSARNYLWLEWSVEYAAGSSRWQIFDPDGVAIGEVSLLAEATLVHVEGNVMVTLELDAYDVPYVAVYELEDVPWQ